MVVLPAPILTRVRVKRIDKLVVNPIYANFVLSGERKLETRRAADSKTDCKRIDFAAEIQHVVDASWHFELTVFAGQGGRLSVT